MQESKLIFMEGLPSTGKSTNSGILLAQLNRNGKKARWIHEVARPHPTLFFYEACLKENEYRRLLEKYPSSEILLNRLKTSRKNTIVFDLLELEWNYSHLLDSDALDEIKSYDVWNFSIEQYIEVSLEKWQHFVEEQLQRDEIIILDSSLFQFQIYTFVLAGVSFSKLEAYIKQIYEIVAPLNPSLVYLYRENTEDTIDYLIRARGISFLERIWERDQKQPYYQNRPAGAEGYKMFLRDYDKYARLLFDSSPLSKLAIEISRGNWNEYVNELLKFYHIDYKEFPTYPFPNGRYHNEKLGISIEIKNETCILPGGGQKKLLAKSETEFYLNDLPVILRYTNDRLVIEGEQLCDRWTTKGTIYTRLN
ncbi:P-loop NTPase family protein [Pseudoneobacillus sp. C159]